MKRFAIMLALVIFACLFENSFSTGINQKRSVLRKISAAAYDGINEKNVQKINSYRKKINVPLLEYDSELMSLAEKEAQRQASVQKLNEFRFNETSKKCFVRNIRYIGEVKLTKSKKKSKRKIWRRI
jgi:hypothetical protein